MDWVALLLQPTITSRLVGTGALLRLFFLTRSFSHTVKTAYVAYFKEQFPKIDSLHVATLDIEGMLMLSTTIIQPVLTVPLSNILLAAPGRDPVQVYADQRAELHKIEFGCRQGPFRREKEEKLRCRVVDAEFLLLSHYPNELPFLLHCFKVATTAEFDQQWKIWVSHNNKRTFSCLLFHAGTYLYKDNLRKDVKRLPCGEQSAQSFYEHEKAIYLLALQANFNDHDRFSFYEWLAHISHCWVDKNIFALLKLKYDKFPTGDCRWRLINPYLSTLAFQHLIHRNDLIKCGSHDPSRKHIVYEMGTTFDPLEGRNDFPPHLCACHPFFWTNNERESKRNDDVSVHLEKQILRRYYDKGELDKMETKLQWSHKWFYSQRTREMNRKQTNNTSN